MRETVQDLCYILGHEWEMDELMYSTSYLCSLCNTQFTYYSNTGRWLINTPGRNIGFAEWTEVPSELLAKYEGDDDDGRANCAQLRS